MKGKGKAKKAVTISDNRANMAGKKCYMRSSYLSQYLDCNNIGDIYFSLTTLNKWEFIKTDIDGGYYIKHIPTQLYLTSNEKGDFFGTVELNSTFQKWYVYPTSEPEVYAYQNCSNGLYTRVSMHGEIFLDVSEETPEEKKEKLEKNDNKNKKQDKKDKKGGAADAKEKTGLFYTFQFFPKK